MGGGCALNVLTNRALIDEGIFEDVHVFPGTSDSGLAFGSAIHGAVIKGETLKLPSNLAFLGREYTNVEIEEAIYETFKM
jgi:predicted NodU family carbamoyl transferase